MINKSDLLLTGSIREYTVTFVSNNATYKSYVIKSGKTVSAPSNPPPSTGYQFSRWATSNGTTVNFPYKVTSDVIFYAQFTYIGVTTTQSGSLNVNVVYNTTQRPSGGMFILHIGYIPSFTVTFSKAFISIPSVSISIPNPSNSIYRTLPSTVDCQSITNTGFITARTNDSTVTIQHPNSDYGCSGHAPTINWTATGRA